MCERRYIEHMTHVAKCSVCGGVIEAHKEAYERVKIEHAFSRIPLQEERVATYTHPECEDDATKERNMPKDKKGLLDHMLAAITKRIDAMREGEADRDLRSLKHFVEGVFSEAREDYYGNG